ncbi:MAG: deoxyribodipyrimidine photo-lyase [Rhodobacter sp.]|nr:deoxyribodipyrimidine photo-lyase [Rhodobacter sp.]
MGETSPIIVWVRRDLRLSDHAALSAAAASGRPVIPVFIHDEVVEGLGAAPKWRFGLGVAAFAEALERIGARLVLRRGAALPVLRALIAETGAGAVWWQRAYDPAAKARDGAVKAALKAQGVAARSFPGHLLFEPWTVETKTGGFYKVYTPFWKAVKDRPVGAAVSAVTTLTPPPAWPASERLEAWAMGADMRRGAAVTGRYVRVGEAAAQDRLAVFLDTCVSAYAEARDLPGVAGTSRLSENLTYGEISPRVVWHAGMRALHEGAAGAETFLKELVWREFAYHLLHHTPHIAASNWRRDWDAFAWNEDAGVPEVVAWTRGRTGIEFVDAAMRELYVTGYMHNRARMIVASYLTKHLLSHWKIGLRWFEEHLIDWDQASNAMGWQWAAGSGPDAAPYFRVFNPVTQLDKFDRDRAYTRAWIAEGQGAPPATALQYFDAIPRSWGLSPHDPYPQPVVTAEAGRKRALDAYATRGF